MICTTTRPYLDGHNEILYPCSLRGIGEVNVFSLGRRDSPIPCARLPVQRIWRLGSLDHIDFSEPTSGHKREGWLSVVVTSFQRAGYSVICTLIPFCLSACSVVVELKRPSCFWLPPGTDAVWTIGSRCCLNADPGGQAVFIIATGMLQISKRRNLS